MPWRDSGERRAVAREDLGRAQEGVLFLRVLEDEDAADRFVRHDAVADARDRGAEAGGAGGEVHGGRRTLVHACGACTRALPIGGGRFALELPMETPPEQLLAELISEGGRLVSLNPLRETLEDFFVEKVESRG